MDSSRVGARLPSSRTGRNATTQPMPRGLQSLLLSRVGWGFTSVPTGDIYGAPNRPIAGFRGPPRGEKGRGHKWGGDGGRGSWNGWTLTIFLTFDLRRCRRWNCRSRRAVAETVAPHSDDVVNRLNYTTERHRRRRTGAAEEDAPDAEDISVDAAERTGSKTGPAAVNNTNNTHDQSNPIQ